MVFIMKREKKNIETTKNRLLIYRTIINPWDRLYAMMIHVTDWMAGWVIVCGRIHVLSFFLFIDLSICVDFVARRASASIATDHMNLRCFPSPQSPLSLSEKDWFSKLPIADRIAIETLSYTMRKPYKLHNKTAQTIC